MTKEFIESLKLMKEKKFKFEDVKDKAELARKFVENVGNHDSFVRDGLICPALGNILYYDHLSREEFIEITISLMGEKGMKYDMNNYYELSVLTRSFSILGLVIVVYRQRKDKVLPEQLFKELYMEFIDYFRNETDFRGYIEEIGWAHSVAHSADLFKQLFKCEDIDIEVFKTMLEYIKERFMINNYVFISDEDERMVDAVYELLDREVLKEEFIVQWIQGFKGFEKLAKFPEDYNVDINIRNFLRALYFRLIGNEKFNNILPKLLEVIDELNTHKKTA